MVDAAWGGAGDADVVVLLVDAAKGIDRGRGPHSRQGCRSPRASACWCSTRSTGSSTKSSCWRWPDLITKRIAFDTVLMISATEGDGVDDLKAHLARIVPEGPWHYPEDDISAAPMRQLAAEITREKIYHFLHQELPYVTTVETTSWQERKDGSVRIEQTIFVERDSQKVIVLGKGGQTIKKLSSEARRELTGILERRCICSCSSRCAKAGARTRSATARWAWSFPRIEVMARRIGFEVRPGVLAIALAGSKLSRPRQPRCACAANRSRRRPSADDGDGGQESCARRLEGRGSKLGTGYDGWRLALDKILTCKPGERRHDRMRGQRQPCAIEQAPNTRELREKRLDI